MTPNYSNSLMPSAPYEEENFKCGVGGVLGLDQGLACVETQARQCGPVVGTGEVGKMENKPASQGFRSS